MSHAVRPNATIRATSGALERLRILQDNRTIAMVGLSADPMRPSHFAAIYMQAEGYDIIPVNPRYAGQKLLGQTVYASLEEIPHPVDMVDVFRKPSEVPAVAQSAIDIGAKRGAIIHWAAAESRSRVSSSTPRPRIELVQKLTDAGRTGSPAPTRPTRPTPPTPGPTPRRRPPARRRRRSSRRTSARR